MTRAKYYQLLNIAKGELAMDEDAYRALLSRHGGKADKEGRVSAKSLSDRGLWAALAEMQRKGFVFKPKAQADKNDWRTPRIGKIQAMWAVMAEAGVVRDGSGFALRTWCKTVAGVERLEWAKAKQLDDCIEGLKAWAQREGFGIRYVGEERHTEIYKTR